MASPVAHEAAQAEIDAWLGHHITRRPNHGDFMGGCTPHQILTIRRTHEAA